MGFSVKELRRSLGNFLAITRNRLAGRSYVPQPRNALCIETSARCNLACRFCAYPKMAPGGFMSTELFTDVVDQAVARGVAEFWLTPMLGEVFSDPHCEEKFQVLEATEGVRDFGFYTNFIMPRPETIRNFVNLKKFSSLLISIYGHDRETFQQVARKPGAQYDRLMANLATLKETLAAKSFAGGVHFTFRTLGGIDSANLPKTELTELVGEIVAGHGATVMVADDYDTWAGTITPEDVRDIGTELTDGRNIYMRGACTLLFSGAQVKADGAVHACACRDVDGSLVIGDIGEKPLEWILSSANPAYMKIIDDQEKARFGPNCRSCSMYRSIYDHRAAHQGSRWQITTLAEALRLIEPAGDK